jgi:hypothetical protein
MYEFKEPVQIIASLSPLQRIRKWKWWFVILAILGLLAAVYSIASELRRADPDPQDDGRPRSGAVSLMLIPSLSAQSPDTGAVAESTSPSTNQKAQDDPMKPYVMGGIFMIIGVVTLASLWVTLTSSEEKRLAAASDTLKTCLGFFIGVATGYF